MKPWILILGGVILSILLILWMYLFFAGDTARNELFNALNFGDTTGENLAFEDFFGITDDESDVLAPLRQLSLRRIVGYAPQAATASSSSMVYAAEAGTGHIYTIDPVSGSENRISNITVPAAAHVVFNDNKTFAVVKSALTQGTLTVISLPHGSTTLDSYTIAADAFSFSLSGDDILLYAEYSNSSVIAYAYNLVKKTQTTLFTLPFRDATIIWGDAPTATHFAYPKTASQLEGSLYQIKNGTMGRLPISGYGLSSNSNGQYTVFTKRVEDTYQSSLYANESRSLSNLSFSFLPEKCTFLNDSMLCGLSTEPYTEQSPDTWYSGEVTYSDELWHTNVKTGDSTYILGLEAESGRQLDVVFPRVQSDAAAVFFINKIDQSLWIYEGDFMFNSGNN